MRIAFIGGGNMTYSLVGGLCARGVPAGNLTVADPAPQQVERLCGEFGVRGTPDNVRAATDADLIVLAVKPQDMRIAARELAAADAGRRRVVLSIAAGIRLANLAAWLGPDVPIVRAMPNRPALVGAGISAAYPSANVTADERTLAGEVLSAVGSVVWLEDEAQMDAVTAVSGSGPAYFFLLIEAIEDAGVALGLSRETARRLAVRTALGAGRMAAESPDPPALLREQVTSRGGTTSAALAVLEAAGVRGIFAEAIAAAARRSAELADEFGNE